MDGPRLSRPTLEGAHAPSRWVGEIGPFSAELDEILGEIRRKFGEAEGECGEDADREPDPRLAAHLATLSDAQLVATALGVELR